MNASFSIQSRHTNSKQVSNRVKADMLIRSSQIFVTAEKNKSAVNGLIYYCNEESNRNDKNYVI